SVMLTDGSAEGDFSHDASFGVSVVKRRSGLEVPLQMSRARNDGKGVRGFGFGVWRSAFGWYSF
ncbi:MAG: hypothetical protein LAT84_09250, partial [Balneolia bacterium]|nr:hypothetical protein [Balneolia bacterium]